MTYEILIVDDQKDIRQILSDILTDEGYQTRNVGSGHEAIEEIKYRCPHMVILDVWLNDARFDGLKILSIIRDMYPNLAVVMISGHSTIETAVNALKQGAYDFLEKPFQTERLLNVVSRTLEMSRLQSENDLLRQESNFNDELIGTSQVTQLLRQQIEKIAKTNSRVLIEGPPGSGKEMVARLIHQKSLRHQKPFLSLSCANLEATTFEEEFFGRESSSPGGSENGLFSIKLGALEKTDGGTLFLEGIQDMPLQTQAKILQVVRDQKFMRLGGSKPLITDVRLISSSSLNIVNKIKQGLFREDLYYRLNVVPLKVPSLLERREDIVILSEYFLNKFSVKMGIPKKIISNETKVLLESYNWPGNVRQLRNMMEWIGIMYPDIEVVKPNSLPSELSFDSQKSSEALMDQNFLFTLQLKEAREEFEKNYISLHLKRFNGNISKAAMAIGMERTALYRKIKLLNMGETHPYTEYS